MPRVNRIQDLVGVELFEQLEAMVVTPKWDEATEAVALEYYGKVDTAALAKMLEKINPPHKYTGDMVRHKVNRLQEQR